MNEQMNFEAARAKCRDGIAARQVQLADLAGATKQAESCAMQLTADAVAGRATEAERSRAFDELEATEKRSKHLSIEIAGLEREIARIDSEESEWRRQRALEDSAEYAEKAIAAARALDAHLVPGQIESASAPQAFGPVISDLIRNQNAGAEAWPDKSAARRPDKIAPAAIGGGISASRLQQFVGHVWAALCVASDEALPYEVGPAITAFTGSGKGYFEGMARNGLSPLFSQMFTGGWPAAFDEAGRADLADKMRAALEATPQTAEPKPTPAKGRKAA